MSADVLAKVDAYIARHKISATHFSLLVGNKMIVTQMRRGRPIFEVTRVKIEAQLARVPARKPPPTYQSKYSQSRVHDDLESYSDMVERGSQRLLRRMIETGQCAPGLSL
jgi:hypothetical protein